MNCWRWNKVIFFKNVIYRSSSCLKVFTMIQKPVSVSIWIYKNVSNSMQIFLLFAEQCLNSYNVLYILSVHGRKKHKLNAMRIVWMNTSSSFHFIYVTYLYRSSTIMPLMVTAKGFSVTRLRGRDINIKMQMQQ